MYLRYVSSSWDWTAIRTNIETPFLAPLIVSACRKLLPEYPVAHEHLVAAHTMASPAEPDSAAVDGSTGSAVDALLSRVVETPGLIAACMGYQDGTEMALYQDGDVAASEGHLSLLMLRRALHTSCIEGGSTAGGTGGGCGSSDTKTRSIRKGSRRTGGVRAKDDYERNHLEDLKFSHRAADWAAAQGHLEVVRSAILLFLPWRVQLSPSAWLELKEMVVSRSAILEKAWSVLSPFLLPNYFNRSVVPGTCFVLLALY